MSTTTARRRDPFVGLTLAGKYEVVSPLARGGMGRVYRALQQPLGREVALKILDADQLEGQAAIEDFQQRFFMEAAACAKLHHPNTVVVYDYGKTEEGDLFIAMEMLEGETLQDLIEREGALDPSRAIHIALQICGSIGGAHDQGMVHRDLKPSNVMLTPRGADPNFVKVLDFGLVKHDDQGLTQSGALLGTPRYMAPEQITASKVGPAADIYSLGAVLYHMLAGRPPFDSESKFVLLAAHMNETAPALREANPSTTASAELDAVVMRCLRKQVDERYPSMEAMARALAFCPEDTDTANSSLPRASARAIEPPGELDATSLAKPKAPAPMPSGAREVAVPEAPPADSRIRAVALGTVILGALLAVGLWFAFLRPVDEEAVVEASDIEQASDGETSMEASQGASSEMSSEMSTASAPVDVQINSDPPGARVTSDGHDLGNTPTVLAITPGEARAITLSLSGHESRTLEVSSSQPVLNVRLSRRRGSTGQMAQTAMTGEPEIRLTRTREETMVETMEETMVEAPPSAMTPSSMMSGTDNRDPWAN